MICQRVPSHRSARVRSLVAVARAPAATQVPAGPQETPLSSLPALPALPGGTAAGARAHRVPSHRTASARAAPPAVRYSPTATQARGPAQETPNSPVVAAPAGRGTGCTAHRLPSHRSASGTFWPAAVTDQPTAAQSAAATQDTPLSPLQTAPAGSGVSWTVQWPPARRSARARPAPD